jgi:hypothetical protein
MRAVDLGAVVDYKDGEQFNTFFGGDSHVSRSRGDDGGMDGMFAGNGCGGLATPLLTRKFACETNNT